MTEYHSIAAEEFRTETEKPHWHCTLAELHPKEIAFFKQRFVWSSNKGGCYVRHRYEKLERSCETPIPKWCPLKTRGNWQHLYPALVDSLVEKHLNLDVYFDFQDNDPQLTVSSQLLLKYWHANLHLMQTGVR